ncbi:hypothetical protein ACS0TY_009814 [Phlomoides rotata]
MTSRMSILRVKNVIKSHENVLADFLTRLKQSEFDTNTTRVKHLQENITELQKKYDQLTLNVKVSVNVQQANLDTVQTSINRVRGEGLEIKFISVASEDTTNAIKYPIFHFMKLQMPDKKAFTYIKEQEIKPALVVNLTEDEISTRRAWGIWACLTEMDKVKYLFKIYQNSVNVLFLLNAVTGGTIRFTNDTFKQKMEIIWENKLIGT